MSANFGPRSGAVAALITEALFRAPAPAIASVGHDLLELINARAEACADLAGRWPALREARSTAALAVERAGNPAALVAVLDAVTAAVLGDVIDPVDHDLLLEAWRGGRVGGTI